MNRRSFGWLRRLPSGRWQASYVGPDGVRRLAPTTFGTKTDASTWLTLREAELVRNEWTDPDLGRLMLADYGDRWIAEHRLSERTRELYESLFRLHVRPFLGSRRLDAVTSEAVRSWHARLLGEGRSATTAAKAYRLLRAILSTAVEDGRIRRNPCRLRGADQESAPVRSVASVRQVFALADAIGGRYRALVLTAGFAGLRWGELLALRRMDVDLEGAVIVVSRSMGQLSSGRLVVGPPKSQAGVRTVTIPAVLVEELREHLRQFVGDERDALVFTGPTGAAPKRGNWRNSVKWAASVEAAGLPTGFHFHDLRHTGNHLAALSGASTRELMHRMGHSTMRAALVYQHATDERSRQIADRLSAVIESQRPAGFEAQQHMDSTRRSGRDAT